MYLYLSLYTDRGIPRWLRGKESACQCRRCRLDPWVGKILWRRKWKPTLAWKNPMDRGAWQAVVHRVIKELDVTEHKHIHWWWANKCQIAQKSWRKISNDSLGLAVQNLANERSSHSFKVKTIFSLSETSQVAWAKIRAPFDHTLAGQSSFLLGHNSRFFSS